MSSPHPNPSPGGRGKYLLISGLLIIGAITIALTRFEPDQPPPQQQPNPVVLPQPNPVVVAPILPTATPTPTTEDAGLTIARDVVLHVTKSGLTAIGTRIDLEAPDGGLIGGTVNTFGTLTLPLEPGLWKVRQPRTEPSTLLISSATESAELVVLAERVVTGVVVDRSGNPVPLATVSAQTGDTKAWTTKSAPDGTFTLDTPTDGMLKVFATKEKQRSREHYFRAPQNLTLTLEPTFDYQLSATGPMAKTARLVVRHGFGINTCIGVCNTLVPEGEVTASGVSFNSFAVFSGRIVERVNATVVRQLKLEPAPPLTGRLLDANGTPIPGAQLRLNRFNMNNEAYLSGEMPKAMGFDNTVITDSNGAFTVAFPAENFPIWVLTADAPYVLDRRVLVVPGDAPLELRAK